MTKKLLLCLVLVLFLGFTQKLHAARLIHRWSFNGDLADSAGNSDARIISVGSNQAYLTSSEVVLTGGARDQSDYVLLGNDLLAGYDSVTLQFWATQHTIRNWSRIFDFGADNGRFLMMSWTRGTSAGQDRVEWWDSVTTTRDDTNAPYTTGVEYHIVMVIESGVGAGGQTRVTWYAAPSAHSQLGAPRGSFDTPNTLTALNDTFNWLGRSFWTGDHTASASYNEVRIWDGALAGAELEMLHTLGPDNVVMPPHSYQPPDGAVVDLTVSELCWTNPEPTRPGATIRCDVYFGNQGDYDPDLANEGLTRIAFRTEQTCVSIPSELMYNTHYYWRVTFYESHPDGPEIVFVGPTQSFRTIRDPEAPFEQPSTLGVRQMERLDRGVVAVRTGGNQVYVGWRLLGTEWGKDIGFHIYRGATRITASPLTGATNYVDTTGINSTYSVSAVVNGMEQPASEPAAVWTQPYMEIPLQRPQGGTTPDGVNYTYSPNDLSVGDLTGDGKYEIIVKWDPSNAKDNAHSGHTGNVYLDAYTLDGMFMWRIDLGVNIRAGAHYTQFMVYDFDGNGRAEIACKTAPGTIDGAGSFVLLPGDNPDADYRNSSGYILTGPEYLTIFDGQNGAELATTKFYPDRVHVNQWGDNYGNRSDRFLAGVAYIDGERPSLIMARGYYGPRSGYSARNEIVAYNWRQGQLTQEWYFKAGQGINNNINSGYIGQGNHSLAIADVTGNGKDDIIYGSATIKHDGTGLYSTGLGHGDALHVSNMDPSRPGFEVFMPHESPGYNGGVGASFRCATTGEILWYTTATSDVGRGVAFDVDPRYPGYEAWATNSSAIYSAKGELIVARRPSVNFGIWWTGDLLRELLDGTVIDKWNWNTERTDRLLTAYNYGAAQNNGTKANPGLVADIFGDWREEVIWRHSDNTRLLVFTTTIPTEHRLYTLMHDPVYRMSVAWQNVAYNQPTHPGFFLGADMEPPPTPQIRYPGEMANSLLWEWWQDIPGWSLGDLLNHPDFPDSPDGRAWIEHFETLRDWDDYYGSRIRGYLIPPRTGDYTFWVAADDTARLVLSTDARPNNAHIIARVPSATVHREWDRYEVQQSEPIPLIAGRKYYIEALHKENAGGDHLSVAWQGPDMDQQIIDGRYLTPWLGDWFGDLTGDGTVQGDDLMRFAEAWLLTGCDLPLGIDLNGDCIIDYVDFSIIAKYWLAFEP